jgi:TonB family protein
VRLGTRRSTGLFVLAAALLCSRQAHGQAPDDVTPPRVVRFVAAERPASAPPDRDTRVVLELTIDTGGGVADARVVESAGDALDRAALAAARSLQFSPARRGDVAIAVTIRYAYVFPPAPAPVADPDPAPAPDPASKPPTHEPATAEPQVLEYGATAEVEAPQPAQTRRSFEAEQLARVPGVRGDAIRAVDILPGVARSSAFETGTPIIRGANWTESQVFLDGTPVPLLFHFGGITSFFQSRLLERVDLYPGNFSARYGRATGGIIDAQVRDLRLDRLHAMVDLSVLDSAAMVEAPIGAHSAVALAARRSNIDFFFEQLVPDDAYSVVAAPAYWDYQLIGFHEIDRDHRLRLMAYGSRDSIELLLSEPSQDDPALRGSVGGSLAFHRLAARLDSRLDRDVRHVGSLSAGIQALEGQVGPLDRKLDGIELLARSELEIRLSSAVELTLGLDFLGQLFDGRYTGPHLNGFEGDPSERESSLLSRSIRVERDDISIVQPAGYVELRLRPAERVLVIPGLRVDYYENLRAWSVDPRLSTRVELAQSTTLKSGVGLFSQPPQWFEVLDGIGNPELRPYHAAHFGLGVEQGLGRSVEVGLEGFYKRVWDRVTGTPGGRPPFLVNDGADRILGAELSLQLQPSTRTFGYLAYTLSRAERRAGDTAFRLFDADQTHVLSAVASQRLGAGWELGARFRYVTGNPTTPVVSAVYDARVDQYRPVYGPLNSEREAAFHQLDLRVEKRWQVSDLTLAVYLEVLNAYNAQNAEGARYSYDYSKRETVSGLPILPNLGVRGEL